MIVLAAFLIILPFITAAGIVLALGALWAVWAYGAYERYKNNKNSGGDKEAVVCEGIPSAC